MMNTIQDQNTQELSGTSENRSESDKASGNPAGTFHNPIDALRRNFAKNQTIGRSNRINRIFVIFLLAIMGSVILYSCINFEVGKELLPNLIAEFMGVFITYILFDLYVNRIQERKQHMLAKYLHYSKLLKHTKTFISVLKIASRAAHPG